MAPKDLLQVLKSNLERDAEIDNQEVEVKIETCEDMSKATVAKLIDQKWQLFEVYVIPKGRADGVILR